jgi:hypothetical protein
VIKATIFIDVSAHLLIVGYLLQDVGRPTTLVILLRMLQNFMMMSYFVLTSMTDIFLRSLLIRHLQRFPSLYIISRKNTEVTAEVTDLFEE